jgi:hypothetical protein
MKVYTYYSRRDKSKEMLDKVVDVSRLNAAKYFAKRKALELKDFLTIYDVAK